jgi:hypothetical protein
MLGGITGRAQKQGSAEAAPVGSKRNGVALIPFSIITYDLMFVNV